MKYGWKLAGVVMAVSSFSGLIAQVQSRDVYALVDPRIGTAHDGQTFPAVGEPFAMTNWTPETRPNEAKCIAPYYDADHKLTGFRGSHFLSGSCTQEYGSVTLMPTTGDLQTAPQQRASAYRHSTETMSPAYYAVDEDRYNTRVEITGASHAAIFRIHFDGKSSARNLLVQPYSRPGEGFVEVHPAQHEIVGYNPVHRIYMGAGKAAGFSGYFVLRYAATAKSFGTWCGAQTHDATAQQDGKGCDAVGAYVRFGALPKDELVVRIGMSFTSLDEARKNLDAEVGTRSFDELRAATEKNWREWLHRIEVQGGTLAQQAEFYTALYHSSLAPRVASDVDGTYNGFAQEGQLHKAAPGKAYYDDFSLWDTFRALHPLLTILDPKREEDMVQSLVDKGVQGGFLPIFPTWNSYTQEMIGDHAVPVIVDAYVKGLRGFDVPTAYTLVLRNAMSLPPKDVYADGKGRRALDSYMHYGYVPLEEHVLDAFHRNEQVSRTLEYAYDDFTASQFARALGHAADADVLLMRSRNWRHVFDPSVGFARGRHADGTWVTPFDPAKPASYITEGVPWQYTFFVPQDVPGLISAMGGDQPFVAKLDGLFAHGLYDQGNEPSHGIAYLYNVAGDPAKTQSHVHEILASQFSTGASGLPGNDDAGQMSAWFVFSAMGFYPSCPGTTKYELGTPMFAKVVIHQPSGKDFVMEAPGASVAKFYVSGATLDGRPVKTTTLDHADLVRGAKLTFSMSSSASSPSYETRQSKQ
ncbi:MAG: GH92 family glycosyl hydrolase [Acidobacteriaceae bacterium]|nr:GH92 family glycosyl hydrolase [Acidobacteriaceae bacterium]